MNMFLVLRKIALFPVFAFFLISCASTGDYEEPYSGCIEGDCENGLGRYVWSSGSTYTGYWKSGKRHGKGKYISALGKEMRGTWRYGKKHGKFFFPSASSAIGYYVEYWENGKDITKEVRRCMNAKVLGNAYNAIVGVWSGAVAGTKGAVDGYIAAHRQSSGLVKLFCR